MMRDDGQPIVARRPAQSPCARAGARSGDAFVERQSRYLLSGRANTYNALPVSALCTS
jgi:hypothetical protein